jgi:MFS transporter, OFA family, oxalate/formate antiporter
VSRPPDLQSRLIDRLPVHYSWVVLAAGTIGAWMTIPGQTPGVSVFLDFIIDDLGMTRSTVAATYTAGTLVGSFSLPFIGRAIDRFGPRRAVVPIVTAFALACVFMGFVGSLLTLFVGFAFIRALGQGALSLVSLHTINLWFVRRRGIAVGLFGTGMALATSAMPLVIESLIGAFGWRTAYAILGIAVAAIMLPVGGGLFRFAPERYGQVPDGKKFQGARSVAETERNLTLGEARRTITFWLFASGAFLTSTLGTGLVFHHFSVMEQNGVSRTLAATVFVSLGITQAIANLTSGWLLDRVPPRFLLAVGQGAMAAAMIFATNVTEGTVLIYGVVFGIMQGTSGAINASVYPHYFGRANQGAIKGLVSTIGVAGSAAGPLLLAVGFEVAGSYAPVLLVAALAPATLALVAPWLRLVTPTGVR